MKRSLKVAIGIALLAVPLWFVDWRDTLAVLVEALPLPLGLATLALVLNMPLSSAKWDLLLRVQRIRPGFMNVLGAYWIGAFFSNYLPSSVGGDVVRWMVLRCDGRRAEAASSILVERITGLLVLLLLGASSLTLRPGYFDVALLAPLLWLLILTLLAGLLAALLWGDALARWLWRLSAARGGLGAKLVATFAEVAHALALYRRRPAVLAVALLLSVPFYGLLMVFHYLILRSVEIDLPWLEVVLIAPMIPLISLIPVSVNGLGLAEGAFVLFYTQAGVPLEAAFAAALLRRLLTLVVSLAGAVFWLGLPARRDLWGQARGRWSGSR